VASDVELDLSSWRVAFTGAEPIRAETLASFAEQYVPRGFDPEAFFPIYGLAESTLMVTARRSAETPLVRSFRRGSLDNGVAVPGPEHDTGDARALVSVGAPPDPEADVRIVDPTSCRSLPDARVGEVWVSSESVARGYVGAEPDGKTFGAQVADGPSDRRYLRTGDLGFIYGGDLFVTSRLKDTLIVEGRNIDPSDVEETVREVAGRFVDCAAVLDEQDDLLVAVEGPLELDERDMRHAIARRHGLRLRRLIVLRRGGLPKTPSGKLRRTAVAAALRAGAEPAVPAIAGEAR
jgi:acyl-CoA synthetase (AMP-forming)/AMP-acid ligase II